MPPQPLSMRPFLSQARAQAQLDRLRNDIYHRIEGDYIVDRFFTGPTRESAVNFINNIQIVYEANEVNENIAPDMTEHNINTPVAPR